MSNKTILTLNPEEKTEDVHMLNIPTMTAVDAGINKGGYNAGTIDESMLSEEEKEQVEQFAAEIDISNVDQVVQYGMSAQQNISNFSVSILKKVKTYDLGEVGTSLKELTVAIDATTEPEKKGIFGLFQKAKGELAQLGQITQKRKVMWTVLKKI